MGRKIRSGDVEVESLGEAVVHGIKVHAVSPEDGEKASMVICQRVEPGDNTDGGVLAKCDQCGHDIVHMPFAPLGPPKVCVICAASTLEEVKKRGEKINWLGSEKSLNQRRWP